MKTLALLATFLALPLAAQDQKPAPVTPTADAKPVVPVLSAMVLKEYYKALAHKIEVDAAKVSADQELNQRITEIRAICSGNIDLKPDGEPQCKLAVEPAEKPKSNEP